MYVFLLTPSILRSVESRGSCTTPDRERPVWDRVEVLGAQSSYRCDAGTTCLATNLKVWMGQASGLGLTTAPTSLIPPAGHRKARGPGYLLVPSAGVIERT